MKRYWPLIIAASAFALGSAAIGPAEGDHILVLMGDTDGYLSPCGCTKPMTGGIRRRASAVKALTSGRSHTLLDNGGFASGTGVQDRLKADALAESARHMGASAVNLSPNEARLGMGSLLSLQNLAGELFVQSNVVESSLQELRAYAISGPFLVGSVSSRHEAIARTLSGKSDDSVTAATKIAEMAESLGKVPLLMTSDGRDEAERLAKAVPQIRLIQFRSTGKPPAQPIRVGTTWLVSTGEHGKAILRLLFKNGEFVAYGVVELGPEFADDATVSRVYSSYLRRVDEANLLDKLPRSESAPYSGSASCLPCHEQAAKTWKESSHSHALRTLKDDGHGRDPDCVGCHVVGLERKTGFISEAKTPELANVGCESCHGPGAEHVATSGKVRLGKVGEKSCSPCHVLDHSPNFEFEGYWKKIAH